MIGVGTVLSFATSRLGMVAIALVAGYLVGHSAARQGEEARALRAANAALRADLALMEAAAKAAEEEAQGLAALQERLKEKLDAYADELASRADGGACRLTDDDIERLRHLQ